MGQPVWTKIGLVDIDLLDIEYPNDTGDNHIRTGVIFRLKQDCTSSEGSAVAGEMVREDRSVSILRGPSSESSQGLLNG